MTHAFHSRMMRFFRDESGTAAVEFVVTVPALLAILVMSMEMGFLTVRATLLERGLDVAAREVRLGTGTIPEHDQIKDIICKNAIGVSDCKSNLRLEMRPANIRQLDQLPQMADCIDKSEPSRPAREFRPGQQNELMLLRACLRYEPLFPEWTLGRALVTDDSGQSSLVALTAFVQEPI